MDQPVSQAHGLSVSGKISERVPKGAKHKSLVVLQLCLVGQCTNECFDLRIGRIEICSSCDEPLNF